MSKLTEHFALVPGFTIPLRLLLDHEGASLNPTHILVLQTGVHVHARGCDEICVLRRLIELGADPDGKGYLVSPLQICAGRQDFDGAESLLQAGAKPNETGDPDGFEWKEGINMPRFNELHGRSPLGILRKHLMAFNSDPVCLEKSPELERKLEELLVQRGGKEILTKEDLRPPIRWHRRGFVGDVDIKS